MSAVTAQAERTGAQMVAEGIEDEADRQAALAMGATLGQGWLFGRPGPLPDGLPRPDDVVSLRRSGDAPQVRDGTRGARLPDDHRLADEWSVVVVGPHYAGRWSHGEPTHREPPLTTSPSRTTASSFVEAGRALLRHVAELEHPWPER